MKLTPGKLAGLRKVSTAQGIIGAAAMDQRGSLQKSLAKEKGGEVSDALMEEFKSLVAEVLTPHASAILLDPEWGLPASKRRAKNAGLLLAYEKTGYDKTGPGRLGDLLDHWSARRLKEAGADCVKILLYYTPFDHKDVNDKKHAWVERIGDECRANDIPFFLEFVGYEEGADEKGFEYAKKKPHIVTESMREFSKDRYGVDVLKVEVPVNMKFVEGAKAYAGQKAYSKKEAADLFLESRVGRQQAVYLFVSGREQRRVYRGSRARRGIWREVQRSALRPCDLERWHPNLRQARRRSLPQMAADRGRKEHQQRERPPEGGDVVALDLRGRAGPGPRIGCIRSAVAKGPALSQKAREGQGTRFFSFLENCDQPV